MFHKAHLLKYTIYVRIRAANRATGDPRPCLFSDMTLTDFCHIIIIMLLK